MSDALDATDKQTADDIRGAAPDLPDWLSGACTDKIILGDTGGLAASCSTVQMLHGSNALLPHCSTAPLLHCFDFAPLF